MGGWGVVWGLHGTVPVAAKNFQNKNFHNNFSTDHGIYVHPSQGAPMPHGLSPNNRTYLGDSVYASNDGFHIILCTDNGLGPQNIIYLDDTVIESLLRYIDRLKGEPSDETKT